MADVSSVSAYSSLDLLASQYRATLSGKSVTPLETRKSALNTRLSALNDLKSKLLSLTTSLRELSRTGTLSKFQTFAVSSSLNTVATATATSSAAIGTHTLAVSQLAKMDTVLSNQLGNTGTDVITAEGAGDKSFSITVNGVAANVNVTLDAGDTNNTVLTKIATAVNATSTGVSASVVTDTSSTARLVFTSKTTGSSNAISMADTTGTLLASLGLNAGVVSGRTASSATGAGFIYADATSLDAKFKLDGIDIIRQSNTVSDVVSGMTFSLKGVQAPTDAPVNLAIAADKDAIKATIQSFISNYNTALAYINDKTSIDAKGQTRQVLSGDAAVRTLKSDMRVLVGQQVSSAASGGPTLLSEIGITADKDGVINLTDSAKLESALAADPAKVAALFNSSDGVAVKLKTRIDALVSSGGQIDTARNGVNSQVTNLTNRITRLNNQIDKQVDLYKMQFAQIQTLLAAATRQQQMLNSLTSNM